MTVQAFTWDAESVQSYITHPFEDVIRLTGKAGDDLPVAGTAENHHGADFRFNACQYVRVHPIADLVQWMILTFPVFSISIVSGNA